MMAIIPIPLTPFPIFGKGAILLFGIFEPNFGSKIPLNLFPRPQGRGLKGWVLIFFNYSLELTYTL